MAPPDGRRSPAKGLQHDDGHSHVLSANIPNCRSYDPTFAYELAVIVHDGLKRMFAEQENGFYYLTVMNENYPQPAMPDGCEEGILEGMYLLREGMPSGRGKEQAPAGAAHGMRDDSARSDRRGGSCSSPIST